MKVKSESEVSQSCPTLSDPVDWSLKGSSIHGIFQARVLKWGATAFSSFLSCDLEKMFTYFCLFFIQESFLKFSYLLLNVSPS